LQQPAPCGLASGASSSHLAGARRVCRFGHRKCPRDGHAARLFKPSQSDLRSQRQPLAAEWSEIQAKSCSGERIPRCFRNNRSPRCCHSPRC
jgi:hypothetical protein